MRKKLEEEVEPIVEKFVEEKVNLEYENLEFIPFCKTLYPLSYQQFYINPAQVNALSSYARDNNTVECRNELGVTEESSITVAGI